MLMRFIITFLITCKSTRNIKPNLLGEITKDTIILRETNSVVLQCYFYEKSFRRQSEIKINKI